MKIRVYTVDFETPRWLRKAIAHVVPLALVCAAGVAWAKVPKVFQANEVLTAADLNANFEHLDGRIGAIGESVSAGGLVGQAGDLSQDTVYGSADLDLGAGTWLVTGFATLKVGFNDDLVGLGLYDQTNSADIAGSVGPVAAVTTGAFNAGFSTSHVVTLTGPTKLRLKAFRNGASTVDFEDFTNQAVAPFAALKPHKIKAVRLR
jgi:hypothetical protein